MTVVGALGVLTDLDRHLWFFGDDWEFLVDRGFSHAQLGIWSPHSEHWVTLPILVFRALFTVFGVRSYLPYIAILIVAHLILAHLIWRVMLRVGVDAWVATALVAVFLVLGSGYENLIWAFQISFVGSVLFGYAALLLVDHDRMEGRRDLLVLWAVLVAGLMCSGIGVTMVAVTGGAVLLRGGLAAWRKALVVIGVPAVVYVIWFGLAGYKGLMGDQQHVTTLLEIPAFVWTGLTNAFGLTSGIPGAGAVLVVAFAGWLLVRAKRDIGIAGLAIALALGVVPMFVIIALGRTTLGVGESDAPRYVYLAIALVLPAVGLAFTQLVDAHVGARWGVIGLVAFIVVTNVSILRKNSEARLILVAPLERQILAASKLIGSGQPLVGTLPEPLYDPNLTVRALMSMRRQHKLPTIAVGPADELAAATQLQVALTTKSLLPGRFPPPTVTGASTVNQGDCIVMQPTMPRAFLVLQAPPTGATVQVIASNGGTSAVYLEPAPGEVGPGRALTVPSGKTMYLSVSAGGDSLTMYLPASGTLQLCQLAP